MLNSAATRSNQVRPIEFCEGGGEIVEDQALETEKGEDIDQRIDTARALITENDCQNRTDDQSECSTIDLQKRVK